MTSFKVDLSPRVRWWRGRVVGVGRLPPGVRSIRRLLIYLLTVGRDVVVVGDVLLAGRGVLLVIVVLGSISGISFNENFSKKLDHYQNI